jgi:hypothetical protein
MATGANNVPSSKKTTAFNSIWSVGTVGQAQVVRLTRVLVVIDQVGGALQVAYANHFDALTLNEELHELVTFGPITGSVVILEFLEGGADLASCVGLHDTSSPVLFTVGQGLIFLCQESGDPCDQPRGVDHKVVRIA